MRHKDNTGEGGRELKRMVVELVVESSVAESTRPSRGTSPQQNDMIKSMRGTWGL